MKVKYNLTHDSLKQVLSNFVAFAQGDKVPIYKDYHKVHNSLILRDKFCNWMKEEKLKIDAVNAFVKGRKAKVLSEIGMRTETFSKAIKYYKGNRNFKFSKIVDKSVPVVFLEDKPMDENISYYISKEEQKYSDVIIDTNGTAVTAVAPVTLKSTKNSKNSAYIKRNLNFMKKEYFFIKKNDAIKEKPVTF